MAANNNEPEEKLGAVGGTKASVLVAESPREPVPAAKPEEPKKTSKPEEQIPLFWKLCSAALLSVTAMLAVTLYTQLSNSISSLRNELSTIRDRHNTLVDKDDYNSRNIAIAATIKEFQANNSASQELWRERASLLDREIKSNGDDAKQELRELARELERLRERLAIMESRRVESPPENAGGARK